jgi:hypothetical protein
LLGVRDAQESLVELSEAVAADLATLTSALEEPGADLATLIVRLGDSCALAVRSYLGFSVTLIVGDVPVSFSVLEDFLDPGEVLTSVMFPLNALGGHAPGSEVVLYAGAPGAFVDLAADLAYVLGGTPGAVQLDLHLTPPDTAAGDPRVAALSRHNQALGILLSRGLDLDEGLAELHRRARLDAISVEAAAQRLVASALRPTRRELT